MVGSHGQFWGGSFRTGTCWDEKYQNANGRYEVVKWTPIAGRTEGHACKNSIFFRQGHASFDSPRYPAKSERCIEHHKVYSQLRHRNHWGSSVCTSEFTWLLTAEQRGVFPHPIAGTGVCGGEVQLMQYIAGQCLSSHDWASRYTWMLFSSPKSVDQLPKVEHGTSYYITTI